MLGLTIRTAMLEPDPLPPCRRLIRNSPFNLKTDKGTIVNLYLPRWMPRTVEQIMTKLQLIFLGYPATISLVNFLGTFPLAPLYLAKA
jgi:hypothetical protein